VGLAILATSATAWAFARDLTGIWRTPDGTRVGITHDTDRDTIECTIGQAFSDLPDLKRLEFSGRLIGLDRPNDFRIDVALEPVTLRRKGTTCDVTGTFGAKGTVLGQFPGRHLDMQTAQAHLDISCRDGNEYSWNHSYAGDWQ
jgi:hypothetical protein